jgi:hypothetical protein
LGDVGELVVAPGAVRSTLILEGGTFFLGAAVGGLGLEVSLVRDTEGEEGLLGTELFLAKEVALVEVVLVVGFGVGAPSPALIPNSESKDFLFVAVAVVDLAVGALFSGITTDKEESLRNKKKQE